MTSTLETLRKQHADITAEILRLETEARISIAIKSGDLVKITEGEAVGQYGRIIRVGNLDSFTPYRIETLPYGITAYAVNVQPATPAEIAAFLTEAIEVLSQLT